jgi:signal transduction histidine kinase
MHGEDHTDKKEKGVLGPAPRALAVTTSVANMANLCVRRGQGRGIDSLSLLLPWRNEVAVKPTEEELVELLAAHRTLGSAPREQLEWVARHGELISYPAGHTIMRAGEPVSHLWVVLAGRYSIRVHRGTGWRRVMEWRGGDVTGLLPYSRMSVSPGDIRTDEPTELVGIHPDLFPEMIRDCHELTAILVHVMLDRARHFRSSDLQDEKLASLGRLAAGLAHELNNPASAVVRSAEVLIASLPKAEAAFRALGGLRLPPDALATFDKVCEQCLSDAPQQVGSLLEQAERQEALGAWLEHYGIDRSFGEALAESALTSQALETAARELGREALVVALPALAASCTTRRLASDIQRAATRVHELVAAVKGFTYMDQAAVAKPVDLARALSDTLTILRSKAKPKSVRLSAQVEPGLPTVDGFGGELNQVWSNLIANAIDAVADGGSVEVTAHRQDDSVVVRVVDDGPGIPPEIRERIFDPFFTTKQTGDGTGLGLAIARSLIGQHEGEIEVESRPGRTEFRVTLPVGAHSAIAS